MIITEEELRKFLNLYWLRPENGLLCTFKSKAFSEIQFKSPSLDLSCGDGLFMFLHLGGILGDDFDYFRSTTARNFSHSSFIDIFDTIDDDYQADIVESPKNKIDCGTDWKQSLLDKAEKLNLYEKLILHDNNNLPLPFENNSFETIYSNSIYWIKNPEDLVEDVARILKPNGTAVFEVMTPTFLETLKDLQNYLSPEAISILDRKRSETMKGNKTFEEWKKIFESSSLKIADVKSVYPNKLLIDIWNIGLRPIAHLLIQMSDSLSQEERHRIKKEWVDIFVKLFKPLLDIPENYTLDNSPYLLFVLKKN